MKWLYAPIMLLAMSGVAAVAEPVERAAFLPLTEAAATRVEPVRRDVREGTGMAHAILAPATIPDVDLNRDGKISFEELLSHETKHDF